MYTTPLKVMSIIDITIRKCVILYNTLTMDTSKYNNYCDINIRSLNTSEKI